MNLAGFVKLPRAVFELAIIPPGTALTPFEALVDLFRRAYFRRYQRTIAGDSVEIFAGQQVYSVAEFAKCWRWPVSNVSALLNALEEGGVISLETRGGLFILTVHDATLWKIEELRAALARLPFAVCSSSYSSQEEDKKKEDSSLNSSSEEEKKRKESSLSSQSSSEEEQPAVVSAAIPHDPPEPEVIRLPRDLPPPRDNLPPNYPRQQYGAFLREFLSVPGRWPRRPRDIRQLQVMFELKMIADDLWPQDVPLLDETKKELAAMAAADGRAAVPSDKTPVKSEAPRKSAESPASSLRPEIRERAAIPAQSGPSRSSPEPPAAAKTHAATTTR